MATITEHDIDDFPGWKRMEIKTDEGTSKRQYRSPGGTILSNGKWAKLKLDHPGVTTFTEAEVRQYAMKSRDDISVSSYNTSNLAIESGEEEYEWEEEPPPPKQQYVSKEGKTFFPRRKKARRDHPDPSANRMKGFYQDVSQQQQQHQQTKRDESILGKIIDIADELPKGEMPKTRATKNHSSSEDVAKTICDWKISITKGAAQFTGIPELRMPMQTIIDTTTEEVWLLDHFDLLGSTPVKLLEKSEVGAHAFNLLTSYLEWGMVAVPAVRAKIDNMKADTELKRAQARQMNQQQQQAATWEQQQQQRQEQVNNSVRPVSQNGDGRPVYPTNTFTNLNRSSGQPRPFIPPQQNQ